MTISNYGHIANCPKDILNHIFNYLRHKDPNVDRILAPVCKAWHQIILSGDPAYQKCVADIARLNAFQGASIKVLKLGKHYYPSIQDKESKNYLADRILGRGKYLVETDLEECTFAIIPVEEQVEHSKFHKEGSMFLQGNVEQHKISFKEAKMIAAAERTGLVLTKQGLCLIKFDNTCHHKKYMIALFEDILIKKAILREGDKVSYGFVSGNMDHYQKDKTILYYFLNGAEPNTQWIREVDLEVNQSLTTFDCFGGGGVLSCIYQNKEGYKLCFYGFGGGRSTMINRQEYIPDEGGMTMKQVVDRRMIQFENVSTIPVIPEEKSDGTFQNILGCFMDQYNYCYSVLTDKNGQFIYYRYIADRDAQNVRYRSFKLPYPQEGLASKVPTFQASNLEWAVFRFVMKDGSGCLTTFNCRTHQARSFYSEGIEGGSGIYKFHKGRYWLGARNLLFYSPFDKKTSDLTGQIDIWGLKGPSLLARISVSSYLSQETRQELMGGLNPAISTLSTVVSELRQVDHHLFVTLSNKAVSKKSNVKDKNLPAVVLKIALPHLSRKIVTQQAPEKRQKIA